MERKAKTMLISTVLVLAILSGVAAMVYANKGTMGISGLTLSTNGTTTDTINATDVPWFFSDFCGGRGFGGHGHGGRNGLSITVSDEYKKNVISIAENDSDVQTLLGEGYNITEVRPIINATVEADGTVTIKATTAIITLRENSTGCRASVWVDVEQAKVARIEILSITVIDKSTA